MEVAGLVIGIVPLVVEVFKTWKLVHERAVQFMEASKIVDGSIFRLNTQGLVFHRELRGLLDAVGVDRDEAENMLKDANHPQWKSADKGISRLFGSHLMDDKRQYVQLAGKIADQLQKLRDSLPDPGNFSSLSRRDQWRSRLRVAFDSEDEFEQHLCRLRSDINDLRLLRPQRQHTSTMMKKVSDDTLTGFITVPTAQKALKALGDTLVYDWSCNNPQHQEHAMSLDLGVEVIKWNHVCSNLMLDFQEPISNGQKATGDKAVRHLLLETMEATRGQQNALLTFKKGDATMCEYLAECTCADTGRRLRGRLSTAPNGHYTKLYHDTARCADPKVQAHAEKKVCLHEVLDWFEDPADKYELAHALAAATLHLHDTPWLPNTWRLDSITALRRDEPSDVIQTLSIAMQLSADMEPTAVVNQRGTDDYFSAGVQNATLFNLGVALLEIEHEVSLETFKKSRNKLDSKTDFEIARRMAAEPDTLAGRRYRVLARKCLGCTFDCDDFDLSREDFQHAVYGGVVYKLRQLVES
ncbi:hypothetical protein MBLNU13_g07525t1 [Cladosporium sp. NU13]